MPNSIKYNAAAQTLALKDGNYWIGTGDVEKGPTATTDYWNGITPPVGGYTIYLNKASGGPSIYVAANDAGLISLTNKIGSQSFTTVAQSLDWYNTQTDKMVFNRDYPAILTNGLVLNVDARFTPSYPRQGTTWYNLSGYENNFTLLNGPTYSSSNGGAIVFDGTNDSALSSSVLPFTTASAGGLSWSNQAWSVNMLLKPTTGFNADKSPFSLYDAQSGETSFSTRITTNGSFYMFFVIPNTISIGFFASPAGSFFQLNTLINITVTFDGLNTNASNIKIYKNGSQYTTLASGGQFYNLTVPTPPTIGIGSGFNPFIGEVHAFQMWNRVLTPTEVSANYAAITM
jgi:hypothetical protein